MAVTWAGKDTRQMIAFVGQIPKQMATDTEYDLQQAVELGGGALQDNLEAAVTATGLEREKTRGGSPGRHETGNMIASVGNDGDHPTRLGALVVAAFGWFAGDFEQYFEDQDLGEGRIPPAHAMAGAFIKAREFYRGRLATRFGRG